MLDVLSDLKKFKDVLKLFANVNIAGCSSYVLYLLACIGIFLAGTTEILELEVEEEVLKEEEAVVLELGVSYMPVDVRVCWLLVLLLPLIVAMFGFCLFFLPDISARDKIFVGFEVPSLSFLLFFDVVDSSSVSSSSLPRAYGSTNSVSRCCRKRS